MLQHHLLPLALLLAGSSKAARPFLDYPDTGAADVFGSQATNNFALPPSKTSSACRTSSTSPKTT